MENSKALKRGTILVKEYEIESVLNIGESAIVYLCRNRSIEGYIAIKEFFPRDLATRCNNKVIPSDNTVDKYNHGLKIFKREASILNKFRDIHGIVLFKHIFEQNNTAYIVMEYIAGQTLENYVKLCGGRMSCEEALEKINPILKILERMHKRGWIHRDITPNNIMISESGQIRLIDLGSAKEVNIFMSENNNISLTPGYASAEQQFGKNEGPWTDVYAVCATLYRIITGKVPQQPWERQSKDLLQKNINKWFYKKKILKKIILKGMNINFKKRYLNIDELRKDLKMSLNKRLTFGWKLISGLVVCIGLICLLKSVDDFGQGGEDFSKEINPNIHNETLVPSSLNYVETETINRYEEISKESLIQNIEETVNGYVYQSYYDDFDGDTIREIWAVVISEDIPKDEMNTTKYENGLYLSCSNYNRTEGTVVVCFANSEGVQIVGDRHRIYDLGINLSKIVFSEGKGLYIEINSQLFRDKFLYFFYDGVVKTTNLNQIDAFGTVDTREFRNENGLLYFKSKYSLEFDENYKNKFIRIISAFGTACYEDEIAFSYHNGEIYECTSIEIPQKEFFEYNNAENVLGEIEQKVKEINIIIKLDSEGRNFDDWQLYNISYSSDKSFYLNYIIKDYTISHDTYPSCIAKVSLVDNQLVFDKITPGMHFYKVSLFPAHCPEYNGRTERYVEQSDEEFWVQSIALLSGQNIIDYCYEDFNADGSFEIFAVVSYVVGTNEFYAQNERHHFEADFEMWWASEDNCAKIEVDMKMTDIPKFYYGYTLLQFGEIYQIQINVRTVARAGLAFQGVIFAYEVQNGFYMTLNPDAPFISESGAVYYAADSETINTIYYGTGYRATLNYPIYFVNEQYYEIASTKISPEIVYELENWEFIEQIIRQEMERSVGELYKYSCYDTKIDEVFYNEIGKIYINYIGTTYLFGAASMDVDEYPTCYATAELSIKENFIESYEIKAGKRKTNASLLFKTIQSDVSKLYQE